MTEVAGLSADIADQDIVGRGVDSLHVYAGHTAFHL